MEREKRGWEDELSRFDSDEACQTMTSTTEESYGLGSGNVRIFAETWVHVLEHLPRCTQRDTIPCHLLQK
jgi:hypothetical protein